LQCNITKERLEMKINGYVDQLKIDGEISCKKCIFFAGGIYIYGECKRNPPKIVDKLAPELDPDNSPGTNEILDATCFPVVFDDSYCGDGLWVAEE